MSAKKLIFGFHAVASRIRQSSQGVGCIYFDQDRRDQRARDLLRQAESLGLRIIQVERKRLDGMAGNNRHQGVIAEVTAEVQAPLHDVGDVLNSLREPPLLLVLDGVQDPHNLGACLRVADAMGAHAVIAPKDRAVGLTPTVRKVASGAAEAIPFITVINLARTLKELKEDWGIWIVGTDGEAEADITSARLDGPTALVMGAEGEGMRRLTRENCDLLVQIPMFGTVESLNVSVASGICLYEARRQRLTVG